MRETLEILAEVRDHLVFLGANVEAAGLRGEVADLWARALTKHHLSMRDLIDVVDAHLGPHERPRRSMVVAAVEGLATGPTAGAGP